MSDRAAVTEQLLRECVRELESQGNANFLLSVLAIRDKLKVYENRSDTVTLKPTHWLPIPAIRRAEEP
jgi:hypothetical protein